MVGKALATIGSGPMQPVLDLAARTYRSYADRHGYDLVIGDGDSAGRPPSWGKVLLLRDLLDRYDEVLWIDSDAIILDDSVDLITHVSPGSYQAMVRPKNPDGRRMLNAGIWYLRGDRAKAFLDLVWEQTAWIDHGWWEQMAVLDLLGFDDEGSTVAPSEWMEGTSWLGDEWNSLEWIAGLVPCRIRHYSARSNEFRVDRMNIDLAFIEGRWGAWLQDNRWRAKQRHYRKKRMMKNAVLRAMARLWWQRRKLHRKVRQRAA